MDDMANERQQLLERRVLELEAEVKSFGQKRAYFMDIYKRKEEEAALLAEELSNIKHLKSRLESELKGIRDQVSDMKTEHMITCISKDEELEKLKFLHRDELSSLNMSLQELINENSGKAELEDKIYKLTVANKNVNEELTVVKTALQGRMRREQENLRTSMNSETLSKAGQRATAPMTATATESRAACSSPRCSEEKKALHLQLDAAHQTLQKYADEQVNETSRGRKPKDLFEVVDHEEKLKELEKELTGEKESRRDLEMYVEVLAKQKDVFQSEMDVIRKELRESLALLEKERKEHLNLKLTWQMANDQFLESQRLLMIDMKRLESVLTEEQQRRVAELQRVDAEREAQQQKIDDLERQKQEQIIRLEAEGDSLLELPHGMKSASSHSSLNSVDVYREFERAEPIHMTFTPADTPSPAGSVDFTSPPAPLQTAVIAPPDTVDSSALLPPNLYSTTTTTMLTEDMTMALVAPQAEDVENKRVLEQLRQATPDRWGSAPAPGSRIVSERQWHKLQEELQQARANIGRTCEACRNYELELQKEQETVSSLEQQLTHSRHNVKAKQRIVDDLEENVRSLGERCKSQVKALMEQLANADEQVYVLGARLDEIIEHSNRQMLPLVKQRENVQKQLLEVEQENQQLLDMHSSTSSQMLAEQFDQPSDLPTALKLLAEFRANIITCKAAKEHMEKKMGQELQMLKDQTVAEQFQWSGKEDALNQEISALQERNVRLESIESEMNRESKLRKELEERLEQTGKASTASRIAENQLKTMIQSLQSEVARLSTKNDELVDRLRTLQGELSNSELVQKDFVKLSQQLQVQLEKIRQAETEVRWEYEDDITQCNNCTVRLASKDKHHCMHCGKIHCQDCSSKVVLAGARRRPTRVCDVCHTILESDATPYFSSGTKNG